MPTDSNLRGLCFVESISLLMVSITVYPELFGYFGHRETWRYFTSDITVSFRLHVFLWKGVWKQRVKWTLSQPASQKHKSPHWKLQWQTIRVEPDNTPPTFYAFDKLHLQKDEITTWMILCSVSRGEDN